VNLDHNTSTQAAFTSLILSLQWRGIVHCLNKSKWLWMQPRLHLSKTCFIAHEQGSVIGEHEFYIVLLVRSSTAYRLFWKIAKRAPAFASFFRYCIFVLRETSCKNTGALFFPKMFRYSDLSATVVFFSYSLCPIPEAECRLTHRRRLSWWRLSQEKNSS